MMSKIKFTQNAYDRNSTKIFLDDKDITDSVRSFKFNASADCISSVLLELYPTEIEIEAEDFRLTTDDFSLNDLLTVMVEESSEYAAKKVKRSIFDNL